ncbi:hypothetical protein SEVIR_9G457450v4 [Setaria viridis]
MPKPKIKRAPHVRAPVATAPQGTRRAVERGDQPTARERVVRARAGHDARAAATQRGAHHTRAAVPALSRSRPLDVNPSAGRPRPPARPRAATNGRSEPVRARTLPAPRGGGAEPGALRCSLPVGTGAGRYLLVFFCLVSRITMGHRFDRELVCFLFPSFYFLFHRDIFFLRITMGA